MCDWAPTNSTARPHMLTRSEVRSQSFTTHPCASGHQTATATGKSVALKYDYFQHTIYTGKRCPFLINVKYVSIRSDLPHRNFSLWAYPLNGYVRG